MKSPATSAAPLRCSRALRCTRELLRGPPPLLVGHRTTTARREVKWGLLPEGLQPAPKPAKLDGSLVGQLIYRRWETPHGWLLGKIDKKFDQSTPRLFKKFNYRIKWYDGWENHMLLLDDYNHGPTAPYKSWVLLEKPADIEVVA